ncbi:hypothetical protein N8622_00490 [bacterium]|nr:hypothetical protein [bacterium]
MVNASEELPRPLIDHVSSDTGLPVHTLIVCRTLAGLDAINALKGTQCCAIASDDPRVHAAARKRFGVSTAVYIEQSASYLTVSKDVQCTLHRVNRWLLNQGTHNGVPLSLLYWESHTEGGDTTQRIQDGVLLVRSYLSLLESIRPRVVILVNDNTPAWENQLFARCATARNVRVRFVNGVGARLYVARFWAHWRSLAKEVVLSSRIVRAWMRGTARSSAIQDDKAVMIQLCSSAIKHFNHTEPLVRALPTVGLQGVVAGWNAASSVKKLRASGYTAFELEDWVPLKELLRSWWATARLWWAARARSVTFLRETDIFEYERLIRPILWTSMRSFFVGVVPHRYRLNVACCRFFARHQLRAARLWARVLADGITAYHAIPKTRQPLLFWQPGWPYNMPWPWPLRDYPIPSDLIFAISALHRAQLIRDGVRADQIEIVGLPWIEKIRRFGMEHSRENSRLLHRIPHNADACIFLDTGAILRGYLSPSEQILQLRTLLDVARGLPRMHLIVKPHQQHRPGALEAILAEYGLANVHYISQNESAHHALNAADLLITKHSTLIIEGMFFGVPAVSALFDREHCFMFYEDAVDYAYTPEELAAAVERAVDDSRPSAPWRRSLTKRSAAFMERHGLNLSVNPNTTIAEALRDRLIGFSGPSRAVADLQPPLPCPSSPRS